MRGPAAGSRVGVVLVLMRSDDAQEKMTDPWGKGNQEQFGRQTQSKRLNASQEPFVQKSANLLAFLGSIKLFESEGTSGVVVL